MIERFIERFGHRRSYLLTIGCLWIVIGFGVLLAKPPEPVVSGLPHTYIPAWLRFLMWAGSGSVAIVAAFWKKGEDPQSKAESLGFASLYVMPAERVLSYLISWISSLEVVPGVGLERGWIYSLQYLGYVAVIYIAAGWSEPRRERLLDE